MKITTLEPPYQKEMIQNIAKAYQQAFAGYPWYEKWEISTIISDFDKEMMKPGAICLVAETNANVIGFTWGYNVLSSPKLDEHLDAPELHQQHKGKYFYIDEAAVVPDYQKKGIGRELVTKILDGREQVLLRTKVEGPMFNLVIKMGGEVIQRISRERVIMKIMTKK